MKAWPLKLKFGLYAAGLAYAAVVGFSLVLMPIIYHHQLDELDGQLKDNAEELFRDLENFTGAPKDYRKGFSETLWLPLGQEHGTLNERGGVPDRGRNRGLSGEGQSRTMGCAVRRDAIQ